MTCGKTIATLAKEAGEALAARGHTRFSRQDLIGEIHRTHPEANVGSINPTVQGLTAGLQGGPPSSLGTVFRLVERGLLELASEPNAPGSGPDKAWLFQGNPNYFDARGALRQLPEITWLVNDYVARIRRGHRAYIWESGGGGVIGAAVIASDPAVVEAAPGEAEFQKAADRFAGTQTRVVLNQIRLIEPPISRQQALANPVLASMMILRAPQGTNYPLTQEEEAELEHLAEEAAADVEVIGATTEPEQAPAERAKLVDAGGLATWWSCRLREDFVHELNGAPFWLNGYHQGEIRHRYRVVEVRTAPGVGGMESPWPGYTLDSTAPHSESNKTTEVPRMWLRVDKVDLLDPPLKLSDFEREDGSPPVPQQLIGGFAYVRRRADGASVWHLKPGDTIKRTQLHDQYGGSRQGGISPSAKTPNVMFFTSPASGEQHGYIDHWEDGRFFYTGEGQRGDQTLAGGNAAILNHVQDGKALRMFEGSGGVVKYVGRFNVDPDEPYQWSEAPETGGGPLRKVVVFNLIPLDTDGVKVVQEAPTVVPPTAQNISRWLAARHLSYSPHAVALYLTALQTKGFVILSGISGTGKTKLAQSIAELMRTDGEANHLFVTVRPDWRDSKPLVGYFNPLSGAYEGTELLRAIFSAGRIDVSEAQLPLAEAVRRGLAAHPDWLQELRQTREYFRQRLPANLSAADLQRLWNVSRNGIARIGQAPKINLSEDHLREAAKLVSDRTKTAGERYIAGITFFKEAGLHRIPWARTLRAVATFDARLPALADIWVASQLAQRFGHKGLGVWAAAEHGDAASLDALFSAIANGSRQLLPPDATDEQWSMAPWFVHEAETQPSPPAPPEAPTEAYFVVLDEMNLARVEYYFAEFLSVLESGRDDDGFTKESLHLHDRREVTDAATAEPVPASLRLPPNLYVVGTVNVDETTHAISPKVLDRAFTLEIGDVKFSYEAPDPVELDREELERTFTRGGRFAVVDASAVEQVASDRPDFNRWLQGLTDALAPFDLNFGHRTYQEILQFVANAADAPWFDGFGSIDAAFDDACLVKILPKFNGPRSRLQAPLRTVLAWAINPSAPDTAALADELGNVEWMPVAPKLPHTANKALRMLRRLDSAGFASYA